MILQTHKELPGDVNTWGCYFMSLLYHAEKKTGKLFDVDKVISIYRACKTTGILGEECFVIDPVSLLAVAGVGVSTVTRVDAVTNPTQGGFEVLHFHRDADTPVGMGNSAHDHFVAGDGTGHVAFDPLGMSNTVRYGFLKSRRIFK